MELPDWVVLRLTMNLVAACAVDTWTIGWFGLRIGFAAWEA
jgi:hypothetical protein